MHFNCQNVVRSWLCFDRSQVKEWNSTYERLTSMVVPRSSACVLLICHAEQLTHELYRLIATDNEYSLFSVVIFRRIHDEFVQKCRENKSVCCRTHRTHFHNHSLQVYRARLRVLGGSNKQTAGRTSTCRRDREGALGMYTLYYRWT